MDFFLNFVKIDYMKMWCNVFCNLSWSTFKLLEHLLNMIHFLLATWCMKWEGLAATWSSTWGSLHIFQFLKKAYLLLTTLLHVKGSISIVSAKLMQITFLSRLCMYCFARKFGNRQRQILACSNYQRECCVIGHFHVLSSSFHCISDIRFF